MLAKRKSELKKKYDLERNKCSKEEQRVADLFMKTENSHKRDEPDDGNTSDSTTTASGYFAYYFSLCMFECVCQICLL